MYIPFHIFKWIHALFYFKFYIYVFNFFDSDSVFLTIKV